MRCAVIVRYRGGGIPLLPHWPAWIVMISLGATLAGIEPQSRVAWYPGAQGSSNNEMTDIPGHLDHFPSTVVEVSYSDAWIAFLRGNFLGTYASGVDILYQRQVICF